MGRRSGIAWTDATWNPWMGCTKVSEGCRNCYAERDLTKYGRDFSTVTRTSMKTFRSPMHWKQGLRVFTCSWGDFFHPAADAWREEAWAVIEASPQHAFLILTKRPEKISARSLPAFWQHGWPNVWLGISAEDQQTLEYRAPHILAVPAAHRFISAEPLLGPLDLQGALNAYARFEWIITGGESGPHARPADPGWFRDIRNQCMRSKVPYFHKQNGGAAKIDGAWGGSKLDGIAYKEFPPDLMRFPGKEE